VRNEIDHSKVDEAGEIHSLHVIYYIYRQTLFMNISKRNLVLFFAICICGCGYQTATFTKSADYSGSGKLKNVYLIVVSDKNTNSAMNYYKQQLVDSLKSYGADANGTFYCCRNEKTDIAEVLKQNLPEKYYEHILVIAITKTVVGHGTSSAREFDLTLFDNEKQGKTWNGSLKSTFDWFVSDENYRAVANKLTTATLAELKKKGML